MRVLHGFVIQKGAKNYNYYAPKSRFLMLVKWPGWALVISHRIAFLISAYSFAVPTFCIDNGQPLVQEEKREFGLSGWKECALALPEFWPGMKGAARRGVNSAMARAGA